MRIARLILSISLFIFMFDVSAQGSYAMRTYAKSARDACSNGVLFYGDFKEYELDHNVRDQQKASNSKFYKAIGTQKDEYFIATCTSGMNITLSIYIRAKSGTSYYQVHKGTVTQEGYALLEDGSIKLTHVKKQDDNKNFARDIDFLEINFEADGVFVKFFESFFEQSKAFQSSSGSDGANRLEIIVPSGSEKPDEEPKKPKEPSKNASDQEWIQYRQDERKYKQEKKEYEEEMAEYNEAIAQAKKPIVERIQSIGYTYSMLFLKLKGNKIEDFAVNELEPHGIFLKAFKENLPENKGVTFLFIGVVNKDSHYQVDVVAVLKGQRGKTEDLLYFDQKNYSRKVNTRFVFDDPYCGVKDNINLEYEDDEREFLSRKATRRGLDVIDIGGPSNNRSFFPKPLNKVNLDDENSVIVYDHNWVSTVSNHSDFINDGDNKLDIIITRSGGVNMNYTHDATKLQLAFYKAVINNLIKQYMKDIFNQDVQDVDFGEE